MTRQKNTPKPHQPGQVQGHRRRHPARVDPHRPPLGVQVGPGRRPAARPPPRPTASAPLIAAMPALFDRGPGTSRRPPDAIAVARLDFPIANHTAAGRTPRGPHLADHPDRLEVRPAPLQLAEDSPEEPAVHPPSDPLAPLRVERAGLGVLDVVRHLVQERVEELLQRSSAELTIVRVDPDQPPRPVVAPEHAHRRPGVELELEVDLAGIDPFQAGPEERTERRHRRLEAQRGPRTSGAAAVSRSGPGPPPRRRASPRAPACSARRSRSNWRGSIHCRPPLAWINQ